MRVLIINTSQHTGGAAIAANRLMNALTDQGVNVKMLVLHKTSNDEKVISVGSKWQKTFCFLWERIVIWINNLFSRRNLFKVSIANTGIDVTRMAEFKEADIIHLHWINQGMLSLNNIKDIINSGKPIVWTMHDMWECTAICHYAYTCTNFKTECKKCPFLRYPRERDLSHRVFTIKRKVLSNSSIHFVAVSSWLASQIKSSALLKNSQVTVIPNTLSLDKFSLLDKEKSREKLGLPINKYILLMGAARIDDPIKGFDILLNAINYLITSQLCSVEELHLVLFGSIRKAVLLNLIPISYSYRGHINNTDELSLLYSAADVTISSSLYETFGQTLIEAQACGCLPVTFNNSGQTDIIEHEVNGYLANYPSAESLAEGIKWAVTDRHKKISREALRETVLKKYSAHVVAHEYIQLYNRIRKEK